MEDLATAGLSIEGFSDDTGSTAWLVVVVVAAAHRLYEEVLPLKYDGDLEVLVQVDIHVVTHESTSITLLK